MTRRPHPHGKPAHNVHPSLEQAVGLHQSGRTAEAAAIYERIIAQVPNHFDATHLLGVVALEEGRLEQAQSLIASALRINPNDAPALNNLGTAYLRSRDLNLARIQFERAATLQPNSYSALTNLGAVLRQLGRPRDALVPLRRAYSSDSKSATLCNLLGACLLDTGDAPAAVDLFEAATQAEPDDAGGWGNLAIALNSVGEHERARECADRAVQMQPESSAALGALAAIEFEQGDMEAATAIYRKATEFPDTSTQTLCACANALWTSGHCEEATTCLQRAIAADGNSAIAIWQLAMSQCRPFYKSGADIEISRHIFLESLENLRTWFHAAPHPVAYSAVGSTQPFFIAYQAFNNRDLLCRYGDLCSEWMATMPVAEPAVRNKPSIAGHVPATAGRMRIGIASAHIRDHSVWNAVTKGWVRHLDRTRFELWLFQLGRSSDEETLRASREVAHFEDRPRSLQGWVNAISEARLDALIYPEIGMDALTTQLASLRLAPVQAASWGHPETTGLPTMDLYLSAAAFEPVNAEGSYRERLVRLPNLGVCVEPMTPSVAAPDLQSLGLPLDEPLLLCPGAPFKYSPTHDYIWARIAKGLQPGGSRRGWGRIADRMRGRSNGRLVFFRSGNDPVDKLLEQRLRKAFEAEKVNFGARVCLIPHLDRPRFFGLMQRAALMLDTIGFSGFNTALQAVEAGLPVLAHEGGFMRGRLASGIMRRMELPELVAVTDEAFIETAIRLGSDELKRNQLRAQIANRREILFADIEPVRALERCLAEAIIRPLA